MATNQEYIEFVCEQIRGIGEIRYKKMFGEYMIYCNNKPILLVCDNIPYVKQLEPMEELMKDASTGFPYKGAKEHYILDIDDATLCLEVAKRLEKITPVPKPKKKPSKKE